MIILIFSVLHCLQSAYGREHLSDILMKRIHKESKLAITQAGESVVLSLSNGLEAFSLSNDLLQRYYREGHHPGVLSYLMDRFEVVEAHSNN